MRSQKAFNNAFCELSKIARPLYVRRVAAHLRSSDKAKSSAKSAPSPTDSSPIAAVKLSFVTTFLLQPAEQQLRRLACKQPVKALPPFHYPVNPLFLAREQQKRDGNRQAQINVSRVGNHTPVDDELRRIVAIKGFQRGQHPGISADT